MTFGVHYTANNEAYAQIVDNKTKESSFRSDLNNINDRINLDIENPEKSYWLFEDVRKQTESNN